MVYQGKYKIIDNLITACDYDFLLKKIEESINKNKKLLISPIASHTLVKAHFDKNLHKVLDKFDYLVPDSQWVKRSISFLYGKEKGLKERVYGPELMLKVCRMAEKIKHKVFFYGNTEAVLKKLKNKLRLLFPKLKAVGYEKSKFRELTKKEKKDLSTIINSNTDVVFISLGSPRQEIFSYELSKLVKKPLIIIPVGAAFDFISENKIQAPKWMRKGGLEWFFRLLKEPKRLFSRYLVYGFLFIYLIFLQRIFSFNYRE